MSFVFFTVSFLLIGFNSRHFTVLISIYILFVTCEEIYYYISAVLWLSVGRLEDEENASDFDSEEKGEEEDVEEEGEDEDDDSASGQVKAPPKRKRSDKNNARTNAALQAQPNTIETAARANVLEYKEHGSAGNSTLEKKSKEIEHARGKSNSVAAPTGTTSESTKSSTNPPPSNLLTCLLGFSYC
ncbi:NAC domain-containing protein [Psidium guajava]|nr:NAC domain-containing protein [Psidium guajava]